MIHDTEKIINKHKNNFPKKENFIFYNYHSHNIPLASFLKKTGKKIFVPTIQASLKELKGTPAFKGKSTGKVKVLLSPRDNRKISKNDILIAVNTTPDYMPAIKKAAAIVTDEGGMLCHAAIVSRELKIPCIVGTKVATKVLKDGNMVEVDANKGTVKIMKKQPPLASPKNVYQN